MIRFQSKAGADILMLRAHSDAVLTALGREPAAAGIFEADALAHALSQWSMRGSNEDNADENAEGDVPGIGRRAWPLLQLLRRAQDARVPVMWSST